MPDYTTRVCNGHVTSGGTLVHGVIPCPLHAPQAAPVVGQSNTVWLRPDSLNAQLAAIHAEGVAEGRAQRDLEVESLAELRRAAERLVAHWQRPEQPGNVGYDEAARRAKAMLTHAVRNLTAAPSPSAALERALSAYSGATEYSITFDEGDVAEAPPVDVTAPSEGETRP